MINISNRLSIGGGQRLKPSTCCFPCATRKASESLHSERNDSEAFDSSGEIKQRACLPTDTFHVSESVRSRNVARFCGNIFRNRCRTDCPEPFFMTMMSGSFPMGRSVRGAMRNTFAFLPPGMRSCHRAEFYDPAQRNQVVADVCNAIKGFVFQIPALD